MKKVLMCMTSLSVGNGIAKVIMNYYDYLIKKGYHVDFFLILNIKSKKEYKEKINKGNSNVYIVPEGNKIKKYFLILKMLFKVIKNNKYDIVHINLVSIYATLCIWMANIIRVKNIIYHIHNPISKRTGIKNAIIRFLNFLCIKGSNQYIACSVSAGKSVFGDRDFQIVRNLIETDKYMFDESARNKYRQELGIKDNEILIGNVARFEEQKNPFFAINIIKDVMQTEKNVRFLWIGEGSLKNKVKNYIKEIEIEEKCIILDNRDDVNKMYSAMDMFFLPSKFEGLGIVFIEAQCAGTPVLTSNKVPIEDLDITDLFNYMELERNEQEWKNKLIEKINKKYKYKREQYCDIVYKTKYDISNNYRMVELYDNILDGEKL